MKVIINAIIAVATDNRLQDVDHHPLLASDAGLGASVGNDVRVTLSNAREKSLQYQVGVQDCFT